MYAKDSKKNLVKVRKLYNFVSGVILFRRRIKRENTIFLFYFIQIYLDFFQQSLPTKNI